MSATQSVLHCGSGFPIPVLDRWNPPRGEVRWVDPDTAVVSTSGPSISIAIDFAIPQAAGREQIVVLRVVDAEGYLPADREEYRDPDGNLSVTATVALPPDGIAEDVVLVLPYVAFPLGSGGHVELEIAVHEPHGPLTAFAREAVELAEEIDRTPDVLTVMAHTLVALVRSTGHIDREEVRIIRTLLGDNFDLDELGDAALRRILKRANRVQHTPEALAEIVAHVLPVEAHSRFVNLMYACALADGILQPAEQAFIDALCGRVGIHDHRRYGPEQLRPFWAELELEPGADLAAVKKAYKRLVRDYHPDRVQNLAIGFQDFAKRKMQALNDAYAQLKAALDERVVEVEVELELDEE